MSNPYSGGVSGGGGESEGDTYARLIVVCTVSEEDGPQVYANVCATVEGCMVIHRAEWKAAEGVAIFQGTALVALSIASARLYSGKDTGTRIRSIDYRTVQHGAPQDKIQYPHGS